ncbi:MAG: pyruvate/2-oxoglutarate dehydrogenase complex [Pseudomonadota bacterium]
MTKTIAALFVLTVFLAACVSSSVNRPDVSIDEAVASLKQKGFRQVTRTSDGTRILRYSGRINSAVECRTGSNSFARIPSRQRTADGQTQTITLDAYLQLSPGSDGILSNSERDGIYIVTIKTRGRGGSTSLTGIKFGPRGQATFRSGLTCRAA